MSTKQNTTKLSELKKKIRDRERRFKNMTESGKRVAIAKDVIRSVLEDKTIKPQAGVYFESNSLDGTLNNMRYEEIDESSIEFRDVFLKKLHECTACAVGSMFVCSMLRDDNLTITEFRESFDNKHVLRRFFSSGQIYLIESAFERDNMHWCNEDWELEQDNIYAAIKFGERYTNDKKRLIAIMQNIIDNNGTFIP
jgi:hypothetical protein